MLWMVLGCLSKSVDSGISLPEDDVVEHDDLSWVDPQELPLLNGACRTPVRLRVNRVVDGDTIHGKLITDQGELDPNLSKIRLIGVDAPEMGYNGEPDDCYAAEATEYANTLWGTWVWLTFDGQCTDDFGRTLAYVHLGTGEQDFFQRQLLRGGYAKAFAWEDTSGFSELFAADEATAMSSGAGGWTACGWN